MAAVGYGVSDFVGGVASRRVAALRVVIVSYPLSLLLVLALAPFVGGEVSGDALLWGAASGVGSGLAVWWFYLALASGPMSVVSPLTAVLVAGLPAIVGIALGERPGAVAYLGIVVALVAVVLVSRESPDEVAGEVAGGRELRFTRAVAWLTVGSVWRSRSRSWGYTRSRTTPGCGRSPPPALRRPSSCGRSRWHRDSAAHRTARCCA